PQAGPGDRARDGKHDQEDRGFFGDRVPSLRDPYPHIDACGDEPERDEDLDRPHESDRRSRTADPAPDEETQGEQHEAPGDDLDRVRHRATTNTGARNGGFSGQPTSPSSNIRLPIT